MFAVLGDDRAWTTETHLLAGNFDQLAGANWQRSGKGPAPKPIPRPSDVAKAEEAAERHAERAKRFLDPREGASPDG